MINRKIGILMDDEWLIDGNDPSYFYIHVHL